MSEGHEENQDMQRISKKIKNCEACLSEDTPCVPQRVLQQREKNVVEAGEESWGSKGPSRPTRQICASILKKIVHRHCLCFFRDRDRDRDRDRVRDRVRWPRP